MVNEAATARPTAQSHQATGCRSRGRRATARRERIRRRRCVSGVRRPRRPRRRRGHRPGPAPPSPVGPSPSRPPCGVRGSAAAWSRAGRSRRRGRARGGLAGRGGARGGRRRRVRRGSASRTVVAVGRGRVGAEVGPRWRDGGEAWRRRRRGRGDDGVGVGGALRVGGRASRPVAPCCHRPARRARRSRRRGPGATRRRRRVGPRPGLPVGPPQRPVRVGGRRVDARVARRRAVDPADEAGLSLYVGQRGDRRPSAG